MKRIILLACVLVGCIAGCRAQAGVINYICCESDATRVCDLLQLDAGANPVLYYARKLVGIPYVWHTLEGNEPEQLVINLHLLNASSIHKKVVEEPKTIHQYLKEHPSFLGIRVLRLSSISIP